MFHPYLLGINHWHVDTDCYSHLQTNTPSKLYNCFINRIEPVRQSWFYFLHIHGLLNQGHVSYLAASIPPELRQGLEFFDHVHNSSDLPKLEKFQTAYEQLRSSIPYRNFKENSMLIDKILDSKYSLVLDTYAVSDDCNSWFISEKAARCLMLPTCHLMFLQKNTLQKLSELGIMIGQSNLTFDQESWQDRQQKSLQILISNQDEYNFIDLKKRALHNHHVFRTMFESNHSGFYDNVIDVAMAW